tara:strand:+ start:9686 stop:10456 length:771 start_codon:yes stop_codon:yes gene_type:complete
MIERTIHLPFTKILNTSALKNVTQKLHQSTLPELGFNTVSEPKLPKSFYSDLYQKNTITILPKLNRYLKIDVQSTLLNLLEKQPSSYNCIYDKFEAVDQDNIQQDELSRQCRIDFDITDFKISLYKNRKYNSLTPTEYTFTNSEILVFKSLITLAWGEEPNNVKGRFVIREMHFNQTHSSYTTTFHRDGADRTMILPIRSENVDVETIFRNDNEDIIKRNNTFTIADDQEHCVNIRLKRSFSNGIRTTVVLGLTKT